jgi:HEAT repeat protein
MQDILQTVTQVVRAYYIPIGAGIVFIAAVVLVILSLRRRKRTKTAIGEVIEGKSRKFAPDVAGRVMRKTRLVTGMLQGVDQTRAEEFVRDTGLASHWVGRLKARPDKRTFMNVLRFSVREGYFLCFKYALERSRWSKHLTGWLEENRVQLPLLTIAHSTAGEPFDGKKAHELFSDKLDEIQDLLGDPDWRGRYFAMKVMLGDEDEAVRRVLFDLFRDTSPLIRETMVGEYVLSEEEAEEILRGMVIADPHPKVRVAARRVYGERYRSIGAGELGKMEVEEILHLIEALTPGTEEDDALATELMLHDNAEIRYGAARFLERSGALGRFCTKLDLGDMKDFRRKTTILKNAAKVGVTGFLKKCVLTGTRETLMLAAEVLNENGDLSAIGNLIKMARDHNYLEVYRKAVHAIVLRGDAETKAILRGELAENLSDDENLLMLIEEITPLKEGSFIDPLLEILEKKPKFAEATRKALARKDNDLLIERLIGIVVGEEGREARRQLRVQALFLLAELGREYCIAFIFEHLTLLPVEMVGRFGAALAAFGKVSLRRTVGYYLKQVDGEIRSHIIALIPKMGLTEFLEEVRQAQKDADPIVRIAATYALVEMDDTKSYGQALELLRDPVEEVRIQVSLALGTTGKKNVLERMARVFSDENEVAPVRKSIVRGVGAAKTPEATSILIDFLERDKKLSGLITDELKNHSDPKNVQVLVERMKDGGDSLKREIGEVFTMMGFDARNALIGLLESDLSAYKEYASSLLDAIGVTGDEIVKLKHRDPAVRREAARILSLIGTTKAFRGLIMASRDPDEEVRVNVVKALEKLETPEGKSILRSLEEDPDTRIRKYTHWALERLRAKQLV